MRLRPINRLLDPAIACSKMPRTAAWIWYTPNRAPAASGRDQTATVTKAMDTLMEKLGRTKCALVDKVPEPLQMPTKARRELSAPSATSQSLGIYAKMAAARFVRQCAQWGFLIRCLSRRNMFGTYE